MQDARSALLGFGACRDTFILVLLSLGFLFDTDGFPPRWRCGTAWAESPFWGWLHIFSDLAIWGAYAAIPFVLVYLVRQRRETPFPLVVYLFAAFILACGTTHLLEATLFYWPVYKLSGVLKLTTAIVSWATVISTFYVVPNLLDFRSPSEAEAIITERTSQLAKIRDDLEWEVNRGREVNLELQNSRQLLRLALEASETGFFEWDLMTDVIHFDEAEIFLTQLGNQDGKLTASEFFECIDPGDRKGVWQAIDQGRKGSGNYYARFAFTRPDGERLWLDGRGIFIHDVHGNATRMIGLNRDVTRDVEHEHHLNTTARKATDASRMKSQFIAQVSHEIRTPLTAMLGCVDTLLPSLGEGDAKETLRIVRSQGELLRIILNDVLDISRIEAGKLVVQKMPTSIAAVLADVCSLMEPLATEQGLKLHWQAHSTLPKEICSDAYRLRQVLLNLVSNAVKFTRQGSISISPQIEEIGQGKGNLVVKVKDTGIGISADKLQKIFEEFEQVREGDVGSGLGLAIGKRLACLLGGDLTVSSLVGVGSEFVLTIPLGDLNHYEFVPANSILEFSGSQRDQIQGPSTVLPINVLAAEDTRAVQFVIKRMLGPMVKTLAIVSNGQEALDAVLKAHGTAEAFDVVLMDVQMPEMSGTEATRKLRLAGYASPIIALTAGAMEEEQQECMRAGCTHFVAKPIDMELLRRVLSQIASGLAVGT
jgi:signal transduction histidine kinase/CheY-like chemotaxis protein